MALLLTKVLLAPLLLAGCSFAAWRWGRSVGGWLLGLPLISGPVSLFLLVEHGPRFAESAARSTLLGFLATGAFCVWYAAFARRTRWWFALPTAYIVCFAVAWGLSFVNLPVTWIAALVAAVLVPLSLSARPEPVAGRAGRPESRTLVPKMAVASAIVVVLTAAGTVLGSRMAGLLAPLPVLLAFMAASAHRREGGEAARGMLRGALAGSWGGVAFFATLALTLAGHSPYLTYGLALLAALAASGLGMWLQRAEGASGRWSERWSSVNVARSGGRPTPGGVLRVPRPAYLSVWRA